MDFLCLELERQRRALAALLLGRGDTETEAEREDGVASEETEELWETGPASGRAGRSARRTRTQTAFGGKTRDAAEGLWPEMMAGGMAGPAAAGLDGPAAVGTVRPAASAAEGAAPEGRGGLREAGRRAVEPKADGTPTAGYRPAAGLQTTAGARPGGAGWEPLSGGLPYGLPALAARTESRGTEMARAMSLAFQRDARRYDGGFAALQ